MDFKELACNLTEITDNHFSSFDIKEINILRKAAEYFNIMDGISRSILSDINSMHRWLHH